MFSSTIAQLKELWADSRERYYLVASQRSCQRLEKLVGRDKLNVVATSGGKFVFTNQPLPELDATAARSALEDAESSRLAEFSPKQLSRS